MLIATEPEKIRAFADAGFPGPAAYVCVSGIWNPAGTS